MFCARCGYKIPDSCVTCPNCHETVKKRDGLQSRRSNVKRTISSNGVMGSVSITSGAQSGVRRAGSGGGSNVGQGISITFVEDGYVLGETTLMPGERRTVRFGSAADNDLAIDPPSHTISQHHGEIRMQGGWCCVRDLGSLNGLFLNGIKQREFRIVPGDVVVIGAPARGATRCIMVVGLVGQTWDMLALAGKQTFTIGRTPDNDIVLNDSTVSVRHAQLVFDGRGWIVQDAGSANGTKVGGSFVRGPVPLYSGSSLAFGNVSTIFMGGYLLLPTVRHGVDIDARKLVRYRKNGKETRITTDHISLHIKRGDFVAIVGGSGCGKSTLLNELNGSEPADEGRVYLDGMNLYADYNLLKSSIGYVPQQDIVYDDLRLKDMLAYAAKLRMQADTTVEERAARVEEVISLLELDGVRDNFIGRLSGGQKKRASIAVELLADPRLLFLDEPTSGLDPGIERKLMRSLAKMAREGRTIILVTHTTLNLHLCDQVVFLGTGGKLCYAGDPQGAKSFFGVSDFVEVYPKVDENPDYWARRFASQSRYGSVRADAEARESSVLGKRKVTGFFSQLATLTARYARLVLNDRARLLLLLGQAPLLAILINLVAEPGVYSVYEDTKFYLFAISCAAFWIGIFDSIQEICKEGGIFRRECDGGLRIGAYLFSKIIVLGALCLLQTAMFIAVLVFAKGTPRGLFLEPSVEFFVATYLTVFSAMCLGLLVSALFRSPSKALALAPILILPQIIFSGFACDLNAVTEKISYGINCRWAIEALGTSADLNDLDLVIYGKEITIPAKKQTLEDQTIHIDEMKGKEVNAGDPIGKIKVDIPAEDHHFNKLEVDVPEIKDVVSSDMIEHEKDEMFKTTIEHLLTSWGVLAGMSIACLGGCYVFLVLGVRKC